MYHHSLNFKKPGCLIILYQLEFLKNFQENIYFISWLYLFSIVFFIKLKNPRLFCHFGCSRFTRKWLDYKNIEYFMDSIDEQFLRHGIHTFLERKNVMDSVCCKFFVAQVFYMYLSGQCCLIQYFSIRVFIQIHEI